MQRIVLLLFIIASLWVSAQDQRGAAVSNTQPTAVGNTYALVVGVSKYKEVTPLRFANRDAEAFVDFLKSKSGGNVPTDNIKVLTDEEATRSNFWMEYTDLKKRIKEGDMFYVYFAGHGDIEQDISEGDPLLLLSKSYKQNYIAGGEYISLSDLSRYLGAISKKGITVVFIADACHSGAMLSGGNSGRETTVVALQQSWGNEIKFLSCQPTEVSEESDKWGGGRGIFSYVLEEGLKGLADTNNDSIVSVGEIKRYLENEVPRQTGDAQNPDIRGDLKRRLAKVDVPTLLALRESKKQSLPEMIAMNTGRSAEDNLLANASPAVKDYYTKFKAALDKGELLKSSGYSAWDMFLKLNTSDAPAELIRIVKRNFVSALQDGAMLFIQNQLSGKKDVDDFNEKVVNEQMEKWHDGIRNLEKAIEILGEDHYLTPSYKARKLYLEAYILYFKITTYTREYTTENLKACIAKLDSAVLLEENASYAYYLLGDVYSYSGKSQKAWESYEEYLKLNPKDGFAFVNLAVLARRDGLRQKADSLTAVALRVGSNHTDELLDYVAGYYYNFNNMDSAVKYFEKALEVNPNLNSSHLNLGVIYKKAKNYDKALYHYTKVVETDSTYAWAYNNIANVHSAKGDIQKALPLYEKAIQLDSGYHVAMTNYAIQLDELDREDEAYKLYHRSKSIEPYYKNNYYGIGKILYNRQQYDSAIMYFYYCVQLDTAYSYAYYWLAKTYAKTNEIDDAIYYYKQSALHDTTYAEPYNAIGNIYYNKADYPNALLYYSMAILRDTTEAIYWCNLGKAYQYSDSTELALKIFRNKALKLDSCQSTAFIQIGNILYAEKQYDSAAYYYNNAIRCDSTSSTARYNLGLICEKKDDYKKAIEYYKISYKYDTTYNKALSAIGDAYSTLEMPDSMIYYYEWFLRKDTAYNYDMLYSLAYKYYMKHDSVNALRYFYTILQRKDDGISNYLVGAIHQTGGNFKEAKKWYKEAERDSLYLKYIYTQYAEMAEADSNYDQAIAYHKMVLDMDSDNIYALNRTGYILGYHLKKSAEGRVYIEKAMALDTANKNQSYTYMASNYFTAGDTATSLEWYFKAIEKNPDDLQAIYNIGCVYSLQGNLKDALKYLEISFEKGYDNFKHIDADPDLDNIRQSKEFKALIAKYKAKKKSKG
ncbi:MAG: tetratricopeptide repeat protein [Chitinophagales bacterium]|nr:tetratricopeptide repeat protein [Chitinophagales bacterium]